jgi:hypothetical protein
MLLATASSPEAVEGRRARRRITEQRPYRGQGIKQEDAASVVVPRPAGLSGALPQPPGITARNGMKAQFWTHFIRTHSVDVASHPVVSRGDEFESYRPDQLMGSPSRSDLQITALKRAVWIFGSRLAAP